MTWNNLFEKELESQGSILAHYTGCLIQNWYFVYKLTQHLPSLPSRIIEAGAGTGYIAIYLSSLGHEVSAVDIDTNFIEKANSFFNVKISIIENDIRTTTYIPSSDKYDLVYNIGVMEHFSDEDIVKILENFRSMADTFIFVVPNFKIPFSYGDERYLSKRYWKRLLKKSGWEIKETISYNRYRLRNYLNGFVCKHSIDDKK